MSISKECDSEEKSMLNASLTSKKIDSSSQHVVIKEASETDDSIKAINVTNDLKEDNNATDVSLEDTVVTDGSGKDITCMDESLAPGAVENSQSDPKVGMIFHSEEQAYGFYNSYAKRKGFSVRKGHLSRRKDGSIRDRHYVCSNEGTRQEHRTHVTKKPRPLERTNCLARIEFKVNRDNIWVVNKFFDEHNHPLASPNKTHMLRSHRKKLPVQRAVFTESDYYYGVKPAPVQELQMEEFHVAEDVGILLKNQNNCLSSKRLRDLEKGDTQFLLDFLRVKQSEDPSFFYAVQLDEKERLTNCFWTDAQSIIDYAYFGDAVSFETTYRSSRFDLPIATFVGVNHHKQIIIFGAALLLDETFESFMWLFKIFLAAMSGKQPKTIFTDQSAAISKAISLTLPDSCHRLCLWHILHNASKHVYSAFGREPTFQKEFEDCIYQSGSKDDFCKGWDNLINKHGLSSSSWLNDLFSAREKWALPYHNNMFCGIMTTKQWGENMDNLFKIHFYRKLPLTKFMVQYFKALVQLREMELLEDYESRQAKPVLLVDIPMLAEAAQSYTRTVYVDFEYEYKSQLACVCEPIASDGSTTYTFRVSVPQKQCSGLVNFNHSNATVTCSCKKFESSGILCMHALKVLNNNNILYLPSRYILKRWTKYAKDETEPGRNHPAVDNIVGESLTLKYSRVCHKAVAIAVKSALSRDALEVLEHGLDKVIEEMESLLHTIPFCKQNEDMNVVDNIPQNPLEAGNICFENFDFSPR
ncbi:protein FAR1-RELATED SEQUENCE 5-like [Typha angustifolia]|uniref:protein FAR1-RELATED SEQUENCE 5-like n=1 Tax=Typha angustifolia TaxID=59011 RepID=UPI003C2BA290